MLARSLTRIPSHDPDTGLVHVIIDTPKGSRAKYKYDEKTGLFHVSKLLPLGACFPYNFGFVPSTSGEDGDALDMLVLMGEPVVIGCIVPILLIGVLTAEQTKRNGKQAGGNYVVHVQIRGEILVACL